MKARQRVRVRVTQQGRVRIESKSKRSSRMNPSTNHIILRDLLWSFFRVRCWCSGVGFGSPSGVLLVLSYGFRVVSGCTLGALVRVSGDQQVGFRCSRGGLGSPSGAFLVLWCGFWVTFGCVSGVLLWVSGHLRVRFWCSRVGFG